MEKKKFSILVHVYFPRKKITDFEREKNINDISDYLSIHLEMIIF